MLRNMRHEIMWFLVLFVGFAALASATIVMTTFRVQSHSLLVALDPAGVANGASVVARARVVAQSARATAARVTTDTRLDVLAIWRGASTASLSVATRGGRAGNIVEVAADEVVFRPGEEVVVFLVPHSEGGWQLYGGYQGMFSVSGPVATNGRDTITLASLRQLVNR